MSILKNKYAELISYAQTVGVNDLKVTELNNVLSVSGSTTSVEKDNIWKIYDKIDPDMRAGDLVLNLEVVPAGEVIYEVKSGDSLSKIALKYPGLTWKKIYEANKDVIKDPNMIHPGLKIKIPS